MANAFSSTQHNNSELENCTFIKTVLLLLVILYHACVFWTGEWFPAIIMKFEADALGVFSSWLNSFHVYDFTLVSGYIFSFLKWENNKYIEFKPFYYI